MPAPEFEAAFDITQNLLAVRRHHAKAEEKTPRWEPQRPKLFYRAVNVEKCDNLKYRPHQRMLDLAFVLMQETKNGYVVQVTADLLEVLGLDAEEAFRIAGENTRKGNFTCKSFASTFRETFAEEIPLDDLPESFSDSLPMYILRTENGMYGASALLFDDVMQQAYKRLGENYYILPSSIHELILVPESAVGDTGRDLASLQQIVMDINGDKTIIPDEDYLSDNIYYYDGDSRTTILADTAPKLSR